MNPPESPTNWQRKTIWRALTALSIAVIFAVAVGFIYVFSWVMSQLQPILVPFAIAGVLAYLLEPVVARLVKFGTTRPRAVTAVFAITTLAFVGFMFWIIPVIAAQTKRLAQNLPEYTYQVRLGAANFARKVRDSYGLRLLPDEMLVVPKPRSKTKPEPPPAPSPSAQKPPDSTAPTTPAPSASAPTPEASPASKPAETATAPSAEKTSETVKVVAVEPPPASDDPLHKLATGDWIQDAMPGIWRFLSASLGGFLGFFGFLLSLIIVPLYLFYFLAESENIARGWSKYLPLRASQFKDEVVTSLTEINGYLIAFFRGQLVVSMINGVATGILLAAAGLDFGILIGFALCFLGIIPYLGIVICWIPAVVIASVQGTSWVVPEGAAWWVFPLVVTGIFTVVQQFDALFITPRILGERVGLHPVTVIFSLFLWSVILGGLLGAILAVPLTATLKVILKRYVWERTIMADPPAAPPPLVSDK